VVANYEVVPNEWCRTSVWKQLLNTKFDESLLFQFGNYRDCRSRRSWDIQSGSVVFDKLPNLHSDVDNCGRIDFTTLWTMFTWIIWNRRSWKI
jgi:hypothetical protein